MIIEERTRIRGMKVEIKKTSDGEWRIYTSKYKVIRCKSDSEVRDKLKALDELEKLDKEYQDAGRELKKAGID